MNWQDYLALALFAAAAAIVVRRAYRAFRGDPNAGCASGCGSCGSNKAQTPKSLLSIGPSPK